MFRQVLIGFALALVLAPEQRASVFSHAISSESPPKAFAEVNQALRAAAPLRADFSEEKRIVALKRPLRSSGTLVFSVEHGLYRAVTSPRMVELSVTRRGVAQRDAAGRIERFDADSQPVVKAFVNAFLLVLSGDVRALAAEFELYFEGQAESWSLGLVPRNEPLSKIIASIVVTGRGENVASLTVSEKSGDTTTTTWTNHVTRQRLTADEEQRFFGWQK